MKLIPRMYVPYICIHNPWIEPLNGQFKDFIKKNYTKIVMNYITLNKFIYYNNNIKIKNKFKTTPINYDVVISHS